MRADPAHAALVNAIVDGELDAKELAEKCAEMAGSLAAQLSVASRNLAKRIISKKLHIDEAEKMYREIFILLNLKAVAYVAADIQTAGENERTVSEAAALIGKNLSTVEKIRKVEKAEREAERKLARGR